MTEIFATITGFITQLVTWVGTWLSAITDSPILTFFVIVLPLSTMALGILMRLLHSRA